LEFRPPLVPPMQRTTAPFLTGAQRCDAPSAVRSLPRHDGADGRSPAEFWRRQCAKAGLILVRPRGLEPPLVAQLAPQASASTNSAMAAILRAAEKIKRPLRAAASSNKSLPGWQGWMPPLTGVRICQLASSIHKMLSTEIAHNAPKNAIPLTVLQRLSAMSFMPWPGRKPKCINAASYATVSAKDDSGY
jgi:hypothetical protein